MPKLINQARASSPRLLRTARLFGGLLAAVMVCGLLGYAGCGQKTESPQQRYDAARALYEQTTRNLHLPSASATGAEQQHLQTEALRAYEQLLKRYPEQEYWCAKALCGLGNLQAAQTNYAAALRSWSAVTTLYPQAEWEVITALKSAADLQWDTGHPAEARVLYAKLVAAFDRTNAPAVVRSIVRGSRLKLAPPLPRGSSLFSVGEGAGVETRIPKAEGRGPIEGRIPKSEFTTSGAARQEGRPSRNLPRRRKGQREVGLPDNALQGSFQFVGNALGGQGETTVGELAGLGQVLRF